MVTGNTRKTPIAMIGGPRKRSKRMAQNCASAEIFRYVWRRLCSTTFACNLCVLTTMSYINAVHEATCKLSIMWILCLSYLRTCGSYNRSWRQLKKSIGWWRKSRVDKITINQIISDICKFCHWWMLSCWGYRLLWLEWASNEQQVREATQLENPT